MFHPAHPKVISTQIHIHMLLSSLSLSNALLHMHSPPDTESYARQELTMAAMAASVTNRRPISSSSVVHQTRTNANKTFPSRCASCYNAVCDADQTCLAPAHCHGRWACTVMMGWIQMSVSLLPCLPWSRCKLEIRETERSVICIEGSLTLSRRWLRHRQLLSIGASEASVMRSTLYSCSLRRCTHLILINRRYA